MGQMSDSWYHRIIYQLGIIESLSTDEIFHLRQALYQTVAEEILLIGLGTGLDLLALPPHLRRVCAVDYASLSAKAQQRATERGLRVDFRQEAVEALSWESGRFNTVVSAFTLCSVNTGPAFAAIRRVLAPGGKLYFLEHGLDPSSRRWLGQKVTWWQHHLSPLSQKIVPGTVGCRFNFAWDKEIAAQGFVMEHFHLTRAASLTTFDNCLYAGIARPA